MKCCPKCGKKLTVDSNFCNHCGYTIVPSSNNTNAVNEYAAVPPDCGYNVNNYSQPNPPYYNPYAAPISDVDNKIEYYKQGNGGWEYTLMKILAVIHIVYESILLIAATILHIGIFDPLIKKNAPEASNLSSLYIGLLLLFFGLFLFFQISGIKKCSTGRFIAAFCFALLNTALCCAIPFIIIVECFVDGDNTWFIMFVWIFWGTLVLQIGVVFSMILSNISYKDSLQNQNDFKQPILN